MKIKEIINRSGFFLTGISIFLKILDWWFEEKLSKLTPILFKKFLHLNLLSIILIAGVVLSLLYLYNKFISAKIKLRPILKNAEEFNREYENFMNFASGVYERRDDPSGDDEREYLYYHNKLHTLFLDIQFYLLKFLEEEYVSGKGRALAYNILGSIEECFMSPSLKEHFHKKQSRPNRISYEKHIIEHFVSYLRTKR